MIPYTEWADRDTPSAQEWCAKKRMYLRAWCDFHICKWYSTEDIIVDPKEAYQWMMSTQWTCYLTIFHYFFEDDWIRETSYFPSPNKVNNNKWQDWYN